jgi:hypothetical protein
MLPLTTPRRACENEHILIACKPIDSLKTVTIQPEDLARNTIDFGIVLCAFDRLGVFLDGEDAFPAAGSCKGNGISAYTSEGIHDYSLLFWRGLCDMSGDLTE